MLTIASQNAGIDRGTLSVCVSLIENGVNPEALAVRSWFLGGREITDSFVVRC